MHGKNKKSHSSEQPKRAEKVDFGNGGKTKRT